jgi:hypothetical protein
VPPGNVNDAGLSSDFVANNVLPAGTVAVVPLTSTHTSFGKNRKDTNHDSADNGTVIVAGVDAASVAEYLVILGDAAYAFKPCESLPNVKGIDII